MSDNSQDLRIHIISDADTKGFTQSTAATKTLKVDTSDLSDETKRQLGLLPQHEEALKKIPPEATGKGIKEISLKGREMREIFSKLNEMIPGLGLAMRGLGEVSNEASAQVAAGEGEVAAANKSLLMSTGPLVVVVLALQAAMEYWDLYKEKVASAAEAQATALDKIRKTTKEALDEQAEFNKAMAEACEPEDKYAASLALTNAAIAAQTKAKQDLLKADEEAELARAKTPEERDAIKKKYGDKEKGLAAGEAQQKIDALARTISEIEADRDSASAQKQIAASALPGLAGLMGRLQAGGHSNEAALVGDQMAKLTEQIKALDQTIVGDQKKITKYRDEARTDVTLQNISTAGNANESRQEAARKQEQAGIDIANNIRSGAGATGSQQDYIMKLAAKIAGHTVNLADSVRVMETAANSPAAFTEQVHRAAKALESFSPNQVASLKQAVDMLEKQVAQLASGGFK